MFDFSSLIRKNEPTPKPVEPVDDGGDGNDGGEEEEEEEEDEEEEEEEPEIDVGFDLNDLLNKIPFMYPKKEPCTWR